jgi:short-subunit dehydrogenase
MKERTVLVTGASSGIGKEIARLLARRGDFPVLVARRAGPLRELTEELGTGAAYPCDVTDGESVQALVEEVKQTRGRIDVLINNAGYGFFGGALDIPMSDYEGMLQTNYLGAVRMTRAVIPHMLEAGGGRIVNIASVAGLTGSPNLAAYSASKFALIGFSESLDLEYAPVIRVGVLCPGPVQTPFFRGEDPSRFFPAPIAKRLLDPKTVAHHAIGLIDRPRVLVVPRTFAPALVFRVLFPRIYRKIAKKLYDHHFQRQKAEDPVSDSSSTTIEK